MIKASIVRDTTKQPPDTPQNSHKQCPKRASTKLPPPHNLPDSEPSIFHTNPPFPSPSYYTTSPPNQKKEKNYPSVSHPHITHLPHPILLSITRASILISPPSSFLNFQKSQKFPSYSPKRRIQDVISMETFQKGHEPLLRNGHSLLL